MRLWKPPHHEAPRCGICTKPLVEPALNGGLCNHCILETFEARSTNELPPPGFTLNPCTDTTDNQEDTENQNAA